MTPMSGAHTWVSNPPVRRSNGPTRRTRHRSIVGHVTDMPPVLTPAYRLVIRLEIDNRPGMFAEVARTIAERGASLGAIDLVEATDRKHVRDVTVDVPDEATGERLTDDLQKVKGVVVRSVSDRTFLMHLGGKVA